MGEVIKPFKSYWQKLQDSRWQEKRLRVMESSGEGGFTCMWCGAGKADGATLHVDHGYYKRGADPWEYENDTLWCLCDRCHDEAGRIREDLHRVIAQIHPAFLKALGIQVSEIQSRLEPLRREVRPRWSPVFCRRCGAEVGRHIGVQITFPTGPGWPETKSFDDIYEYRLNDQEKATGRCSACEMTLEFKDSACVDDYLPSLPHHTQE